MLEASVVIPTRNRWPLLSTGALPSALGQLDVDHEVIVVDDGSTDDTSTRLAEIDDPRLTALRHDVPVGVSAARNAGIAVARGEWVAFLDDDDLWSPRKLRLQLNSAQAGEASWVYGGAVVIDERGLIHELRTPTSQELSSILLVRSSIPGGCSNVVAKTELVRRLGGFDARLRGPEDWDLWLRLSAAGSVACCPDVVVACTSHRNNTYANASSGEISRTMRYLMDKNRSLGLNLDLARFLRWTALERLRAGKRVGATRLLLWTSVRYGRPRYGLQALGLLIPGRMSRGSTGDDAVSEPDWLRRHRETTGWPSVVHVSSGVRDVSAAL